MPFPTSVKGPEEPNKLDFSVLLSLLDSPEVKLDHTAPCSPASIGRVEYIVRTFYGNKVVSDTKESEAVFTCDVSDKLPDGMTLNDFCLFSGKELMCKIFKGEDLRTLALNAIPTPYGVYRDSKEGYLVAVMQLCVDAGAVNSPVEPYSYIPVEDSNLPDFFKKVFKHTKEDKVNGNL